jgi:N-acetylmuramoyl-L-alanine amidase
LEEPKTITIKVDGKIIETDVEPINVNGRVLVPVRAVAEALGCKVDWDGDTQTVKITR